MARTGRLKIVKTENTWVGNQHPITAGESVAEHNFSGRKLARCF
jgi:hypothetical protein